MKCVCDKALCTKCMACVDICPKDCIEIREDLFSQEAVIREDICIGCELCKKVCPEQSDVKKMDCIEWLEGWSMNDRVRGLSSSGGLASEIAEAFIKTTGPVATCTFKDGDFIFELYRECNQMKGTAGSKYVKSNPVGIYNKIREALNNGEKVLLIALPCQVAAARSFCKDNKNLYTIDLICHGTPSVAILGKYLSEHGVYLGNIKDIKFRDKNRFFVRTNYKPLVQYGVLDTYLHLFLEGIIYSNNCYKCKYAGEDRVGNLTLGDSWGSRIETEKSKGISLVMIQDRKGRELLSMTDAMLYPVDKNIAKKNNAQLRHPSITPKNRQVFMSCVNNGLGIEKSHNKIYPFLTVKQHIKKILIRLNIYGGGNGIMYIILYKAKNS